MNASGDQTSTASAPRVVGWLALAGVSLIAGVASYFHALTVVQAAGATPPVAYLVPALADLVILGASADLLSASRASHSRPVLTMAALAVGVVVTLAMNVAAGWGHGLGGRLVAGWPALAFVLALESLAGLVRRGRGGQLPDTAPATPGQCPHTVAMSGDDAVQLAAGHARMCLGEPLSQRALAARFGITRARAAALVPAESPEPPRAAPPAALGAGVAGAVIDPQPAPATLNGSAASG